MSRPPVCVAAIVGVVAWLSVLPVTAQAPAGAVHGIVTDATSAPLDDSRIEAVRVGDATVRAARTDEQGRFRITGLNPGAWRLRISHTGFDTAERTVDVSVGGEVQLAVTLFVQGLTAVVHVEGDAAGIERRRADSTVVVDQASLRALPLAGRNFVDAVKLASQVAPGRENVGGGAFKEPDSATGPAAAPRLSFGGQSELSTMILVDGLEATQTVTGLPRATPSQEAVDQFRVLTSPYQAEYGRALGGFVNIVTRAGTSTLEGAAYAYVLPGALGAQSPLSGPRGDRLRHAQFGSAAGGPIPHTAATWFVSYEGQRRREANRLSQVIAANLDLLNRARATLGLAPETLDQLRSTDYDQALVRFDRAGPRNRASLRASGLTATTANFPGGGGRASPAPSAARNSRTHDTTVVGAFSSALTSSVFAELRAQYADRHFAYPATTREPALEISNLIIMGKTTSDLDDYRERRGQVAGSVELSRGAHLLKSGGDVTWLRDQIEWQLFFPARIIFPSLDAFAALTPAVFWWPQLTTTTAPHPGNDPTWSTAVPAGWEGETRIAIPHSAAGFFVQDQWQVTSRVTATLGLRYDIERYPSRYLKTADRNNLQPRLGLAWNYRPRAVIRAGYGMFTDRIASSVGQMFVTTQWNSRGSLPGAESLFPGVAPVLGRFSPLTLRGPAARTAMFTFFETGQVPSPELATPSLADNLNSRLQSPYAHHATLQAEHELWRGVVAAIAGAIVAARNIAAHTPNLNAVETGVLASGKPRLGARVIPALGDFFVQDDIGRSTHYGLTATARRRLQGAATLLAGYTWGKTVSTSDSLANVADFPAGLDLEAERALSRQHVAHRATVALTGFTPIPSGPLRILSLSAAISANSGRPFTVFAGSDVNGDGNPNSDRAGLLGRGTLGGPAYATVDLSASWRVPMGRRMNGDVRLDAFNLFNRTNVRDLNTVWGSDNLSRTPDVLLRFGSPRDVFNPRQLQVGVRVQF
jgi:outer membrane receptor protein involved in Fe transport